MALIEWPGNLALGIPRIDDQHRTLVKIINQLHESIVRGSVENELEIIIDELFAYSRLHFDDEMRYFREYNFPSADDHEKEHEKFARYVEDIKANLAVNDKSKAIMLMYFLSAWFSKHIGQEDHQLVRVAQLIRASSFGHDHST